MTRGREPSAVSCQRSAGIGKGLRITVYPSGMTDICIDHGSFDERDIMAVYLAVRDAIHQPGKAPEREPLRQTIQRLDKSRAAAVTPVAADAQPTEPKPPKAPEPPRGPTQPKGPARPATHENRGTVHETAAVVHDETDQKKSGQAWRAKKKATVTDAMKRAATVFLLDRLPEIHEPTDDGPLLDELVEAWQIEDVSRTTRRGALHHVAFYDTRFQIRSLGSETSPRPHIRRVAIEGGVRTIGGAA